MTVVVDASCVVAALIDDGATGRWAEVQLAENDLAAPHLMPAEVANVLRRAALAGEISLDAACLAYGDLVSLRVELFGYEPFADRVWELRKVATAYDAWYTALAERLSVPLATIDTRLTRAPGTRCQFLTP
jgi:predicted nucleic acid-binding protein